MSIYSDQQFLWEICCRLKSTFGTSIKLGRAVEMSPKVFSEQLTNCERMSHAASADSMLLSTCKGPR